MATEELLPPGIAPHSPPDAPSGGFAPINTHALTTSTFSWNHVAGATLYQIWVDNSEGKLYAGWYDQAALSCATTCTVTLPVTLNADTYHWWVQSWNPDGYSPWSSQNTLTLTLPPFAPTQYAVSHEGTTPTYSWSHVRGVTWYYLWISSIETGHVLDQWYSWSQLGCSTGTCTLRLANVPHQPGHTYRWWVQGYNDIGSYGAWSMEQQFIWWANTVTPSATPTATITGTRTSTFTPTATFTGSPTATLIPGTTLIDFDSPGNYEVGDCYVGQGRFGNGWQCDSGYGAQNAPHNLTFFPHCIITYLAFDFQAVDSAYQHVWLDVSSGVGSDKTSWRVWSAYDAGNNIWSTEEVTPPAEVSNVVIDRIVIHSHHNNAGQGSVYVDNIKYRCAGTPTPTRTPTSTLTPTSEICLHADPDALVDPICYNYTLTPTATYTPTPTPTGWTCTSSVDTDSDTCQGSTWTPSPTPNPTVTPSYCEFTPDMDLEAFGISYSGTWTSDEITAMLLAARNTGQALCRHGVGNGDVVLAFRTVLQGQAPNGAWRTIPIERSTTETYCRTEKYPPDPTTVSAIVRCNPGVLLNEYTLVHEFGHVLVARTGSLYLDALGTADINDANGRHVFGGRTLRLYSGGNMSDWQRSDHDTDNGWGSAAQFDPGSGNYAVIRDQDFVPPSAPNPTQGPAPTGAPRYHYIPVIGPCDGSLLVTPTGTPRVTGTPPAFLPPPGTAYPFQQNPCTFPNYYGSEVSISTEVEEAGADMFLNWVYWKVTSGASGFQNTQWRTAGYLATQCWPGGCDDAGDSGDARATWMDNTLTAILGQQGWMP